MKVSVRNFFGVMIFISLIFSSGCENGGFDCVQKAGDEIIRTIEVPPFHSINAYDGVNIFIKQGSHQEIKLQVGENLFNEIVVKVDQEGFLNIRNENLCNWVRSYKDINVFITTNGLSRINQYGYGTIRSEGLLSFSSITINAKDGVGDIYLEVQNEKLYLVSNTIANFYLAGFTEELIIGNYYSNGRFLGKELVAAKVEITHLGSNTIEVNATESLSGTIRSVGDVHFHGNPPIVDVSITGKGKLIKL